MKPDCCPFCFLPAKFDRASGRESWNMDCLRCDIRIEIPDRALTAQCENPASMIRHIREQMKRMNRVWIDATDMQR
jgi:translation initiation factor IF-1